MEDSANQSVEVAGAAEDPPPPQDRSASESLLDSTADSGPSQRRPPPPPSPLTGCYLLIVIGEPHSERHKEIILQKISKGFLSWDVNECHVSLEKELQSITVQSPEGEEARYGERLIQYATENLVTEILIHPQLNTLHQCMKNLLSSFTKHRHIIHAGYTFAGNGSWILQDGTLSISDLVEALHEAEVLRVLKAYENSVTIDVHCAPEGDWTTERFQKEPVSKLCKIRINPGDVMTAGDPAILTFISYLSPFLEPANIQQLLQPTDVVGNIRFTHPTLYVFPGGQGDAALFGINGFNMLVDGGFSRKACFWDFARHLDRLDAVLLTRLNNSTVNGISAVLQRKKMNHVYPQIGHFFCNLQDRKIALSPDGDKDKDSLIVNLAEEGQEIVANLRHLALKPHPCYRDGNQVDPVNLYHKVGHGKLDMYVISPARDSQAVKEFLLKWTANDNQLFSNTGKKISGKGFDFPIQNLVSICALLVWQPANPNDTITRILFPGSTPQHKIFEGLDKLRHLEFLKHPVCSAKSISPSSSAATVSRSLSKTRQIDDKIRAKSMENAQRDARPIIDPKSKIKATKPIKPPEKLVKQKTDTNKLSEEKKEIDKIMDEPKLDGIKKLEDRIFDKDEKIENITKEIQKIQQESAIQRIEADIKKIDQNEDDVEKQAKKVVHRSKYDMKNVKSKVDSRAPSKSIDRKKTLEKKLENGGSPPVTPKKALVNGTAMKMEKARSLSRTNRSSPSTTPGKSVKEANNRKVVEARVISRAPKISSKIIKKEETPPPSSVTVPSVPPTLPAPAKTERKPISRRPKVASPAKRSNVSPVSKTKPTKPEVDLITKKVKRKLPSELDKTATDSTVSTPSADVETTIIKDELKEKAKEPLEIAQDAKTDLEDLTETEEFKPVDSNNLNDLTENKETDVKAVKVTELSESKSPKEIAPNIEIEINRKEGEHDDEEEEYLIITKEEPEKEEEVDKEKELDSLQEDVKTKDETEGEGEIQKIHQDEEDSEKKRKIKEMEEMEGESEKVKEKEVTKKEEAPEAKKEEGSEESQKSSDKKEIKELELQRLTDLDEGIDLKEPVSKEHREGESLPDEKFSTTVETSATTAPTLPEDEKIEEPEKDEKSKEKEELEEKIAEVVEIEEKYVKEEIKDETVDDRQTRPDQPSSLAKISPITCPAPGKLPQKVRARDLVKTPDEVADLPMHEEVDPAMYGSGEFSKDLQAKHEDEEKIKDLQKEIHKEFIKIDMNDADKGEATLLASGQPKEERKAESELKKLSEDLEETEKGEAENLIGEKEKPITAAEELTSKYLDIIEQLEKTTASEKSEDVLEEKEEVKSEKSYRKLTRVEEEAATVKDLKIDGEEDVNKESAPLTFMVASEMLPVESTPVMVEAKICETFTVTEEDKVDIELEGDLSEEKSVAEKKSSPASGATANEKRLDESSETVGSKQTVHEEEIIEKVEASLQKLILETEPTLTSSDIEIVDKSIEKELESPEKLDGEKSSSTSPKARSGSLPREEELPKQFETKLAEQGIKETTLSLIESEKQWYEKDLGKLEKEEIVSAIVEENKLDTEIQIRKSISEGETSLSAEKATSSVHSLDKSRSGKTTPEISEKDLPANLISKKEGYENNEPYLITEDGKSSPSAAEEKKGISPEKLISDKSAFDVEDSSRQATELEKFHALKENLEKIICKKEIIENDFLAKDLTGKVTPITPTRKESHENIEPLLESGKTSPVRPEEKSREPSPISSEKLISGETIFEEKSSGEQTPKDEESTAECKNLEKTISEKFVTEKEVPSDVAAVSSEKDISSKVISDVSDKLILRETISEQENSGKETPVLSDKDYSGKTTPRIAEEIGLTATFPSTSGEGTPASSEKELSGKSSPEKEASGPATPDISDKIVSRKTSVETDILGEASPEFVDKITSGKTTPGILESPGKTIPALSEKDISGKTTPEVNEMISGRATPLLLEAKSSERATPVLREKEISGKTTPEVAEKIPSVVVSPTLSGKETPALSERESSGKESPALPDKDISGKTTPEVLDVAVVEKSAPAVFEKDDSSGKESVQASQLEKGFPPHEYSDKLESETVSVEDSGKETPILPGNESSGKVTPDTSERESHVPEKEVSSIEKEGSQNVTPSRGSLDKGVSGTATPDASGKDLSEQGITISSEKDVSENISPISEKLSPTLEENMLSKIVSDERETEKIEGTLSGKASPAREVSQLMVDSSPLEKTLSGKETPEKDDASISKYDVSSNARKDTSIYEREDTKTGGEKTSEKLIEEGDTDRRSILHRTGHPSGKSTPLDAIKSSSAASSLPESPAISSGMISPAQDRRNESESEKISVSDRSISLDKDNGSMRNGIGDHEDTGELEKGILESEKHEKESQLTDDMSSGEEEELKALEHVEDADDSEPEEGITRERLDSLTHGEVMSKTPDWTCDAPKRIQESSTVSSTPAEHIMQDVTSSPKGKKDDINNLVKIGGDSENQAAVKRMLVTACSEDGGVETEICPQGTIRLSRPEIQIKRDTSTESSDEEKKEEFGSLISQAKKEYERQRSRKSSINSPDHSSSDEREENEEERIMNSRNKEEFESLIIQAQKEYHLQRSRKSSGVSLEEGEQVRAEAKTRESSAKSVSRTKWTVSDENDSTIEVTTILTEETEEQEDGSVKVTTTKEITTKGGENEGTVVTVEERRESEKEVEEKMEEGMIYTEETWQQDIVPQEASARVEGLRSTPMEMSPLKTTYITSDLGDAETLMTSSFYESTGREDEVLEYKKEKGYESFTQIGPDGEKTEKTYFYGADQEESNASSAFIKGIPEPIPEAPEMMFETFPTRDSFVPEDFAKAVDEHKLARGEYLGQPPGEKSESSQQGQAAKDVIEGWGKPLGLPLPPKNPRNSAIFTGQSVSTTSSLSTPSDNSDSIINWGHPMNLPSPVPPATQNGSSDPKETPKKERKIIQTKKNVLNDNKSSGNNTPSRRSESPVKQPERRAVSVGRNKTNATSFLYLDLTYVPHHGNSYYSNVEFFKRVRARYYVFSGTEPSKEVYNALLEAKQTWEDKDLEVTIIPTYDTDILGYWVAENEEVLAKNKIDLSPSASRCTINLQDHETSCSAYRLEF